MKHKDCIYYLPIDAFKGICKRDKSNINADDDSCEDFELAPRCVNCSNFEPTTDNLGICMKKYDAFPQMNASTCKEFHLN